MWHRVNKGMQQSLKLSAACFHLGNSRFVNWAIVLQEADTFGEHAMSLGFDFLLKLM